MKNSIKTKLILSLIAITILVTGCITRTTLSDRVWPPPPSTPRVKYLGSYSGPIDFQKSTLIQDVILGEVNVDFFRKPMGLHVDNEGVLYVADTGKGKVFVLDKKRMKHTVLRMGGGFLKPISVASDVHGNIYATDSRLKGLFVFNRNYSYKKILAGAGFFKRPTGLAVDNVNNRLYVSDTHKHVIHVFDTRTHQILGTIGKGRGTGEGYFNFPTHMAVAPNGNLVVTDTMNARVQIFDKEGRFLRAFGEFGDGPGMFARPKGIGVDSEGHIYVVDAAFNNVQIFNDEGIILMAFSYYGKGRGELILPSGLTIDKDDIIYVSDSWNERVSLFEFLGKKHEQRKKKGIVLVR